MKKGISIVFFISIMIFSLLYGMPKKNNEVNMLKKISFNIENDKDYMLDLYYIPKGVFFRYAMDKERIKKHYFIKINVLCEKYKKEFALLKTIDLNENKKDPFDDIRILAVFSSKNNKSDIYEIEIGGLVTINKHSFEYNDHLRTIFEKIVNIEK